MKKVIYLATALTVLAAVASCEKNSEISQTQYYGELRQVTIKAGSAQTRTSVSGGALTWSANDKLYIVPQSGTVAAAALNIKSGVGEASGIFEGQIDASIEDATDLYGWCGGNWTYNDGAFSVEMPVTQTNVPNGLAENAFPSIGTGTITSGISLSNPMGILKLTVKGETTELVKSITVTSAANNLAGSFSIDKSTYAVSGGSSKTLTLNVADPYVALSSEGVNFYVIVPPAEYAANDLTVTVTKLDDSSFSNTFTEAVTVTANNATAKEVKNPQFICFTALQAESTVKLKSKPKGSIVFSTDGGTTWIDYNSSSTTITLTNVGDMCYFRAKAPQDKMYTSKNVPNSFSLTGNLKVSGNIMALLNSENPATTMTSDNKRCFKLLFLNCTALSDASELTLPATELAEECYLEMFEGCTNLTSAPSLPATTLATKCYKSMFENCENLATAPTVSATTLASECCSYMFDGCKSLTVAPDLNAVELKDMCYFDMFKNCEKLSSVTMLATDISATQCLDYWLYNAGVNASSRTVYVASSMVDAVKAAVPNDWKSGVQVKP